MGDLSDTIIIIFFGLRLTGLLTRLWPDSSFSLKKKKKKAKQIKQVLSGDPPTYRVMFRLFGFGGTTR